MIDFKMMFSGLLDYPMLIVGIIGGLTAIFFPKLVYETLDFERDKRKFDNKYVRNLRFTGIFLIVMSIIFYAVLYYVTKISP